ncbi:MAG: AAA family ATPase, partial [Planctomycetaceae bacterium]|nr:AAA family ATPase [Planctomycetaceae bacterium]
MRFSLGVPGSGKTSFGKCLGNAVGLPVVQLTMGKVLGSYVGDSEKAMLKAFETLDEAAP